MSEPETPTPDPGAIGDLIATIVQLQSEGVTHVHAYSKRGTVELVTGTTGTRTVWNDGANMSVCIETENWPFSGQGPNRL